MKILNIQNLNIEPLENLLDYCRERVQHKQRAFLIPLNPIKVVKAGSRKDFQKIIDNADWVFPDAVGIRWAANVLYGEKIAILPGYQVMYALLEQANKLEKAIYLLGTSDEILITACETIKGKYPNLCIVGTHNGFFGKNAEEEIFMTIAESNPDYIFVAMGEYLQEQVISRLMSYNINAIYMGVGGSIDLIAGKQPTPPEWVRKYQIEWLYRLIRQPFRAPRFVALPIFVWKIVVSRLENSR